MNTQMDTMEKLRILTDAAKYDAACTSSGVNRAGVKGQLGSAAACGICHSFASDGRCISLLKVLMTNICAYDCTYCLNRRSNDTPRATFRPQELADLTISFYRRNYIEGLFLSSAVFGSPDITCERMLETLHILRNEYHFNGYIHVKAIPFAAARPACRPHERQYRAAVKRQSKAPCAAEIEGKHPAAYVAHSRRHQGKRARSHTV